MCLRPPTASPASTSPASEDVKAISAHQRRLDRFREFAAHVFREPGRERHRQFVLAAGMVPLAGHGALN